LTEVPVEIVLQYMDASPPPEFWPKGHVIMICEPGMIGTSYVVTPAVGIAAVRPLAVLSDIHTIAPPRLVTRH
jgi:hypothetical protein